MALNDSAYIVPVRGDVYRCAVGTAAPSDLTALGAEFTLIGHIGNNEGDGLPNWTSDGGDVTTLGSWNKQAVRTVTEPLTENLEFSLSQVDDEALHLYTSAAGGDVAGHFQVFGDEIGQGVETGILVVVRDPSPVLGFFATKTSVTRADDIELDPEGPVMLPVRATLLDHTDGEGVTHPRYEWIADWLNPVEGS